MPGKPGKRRSRRVIVAGYVTALTLAAAVPVGGGLLYSYFSYDGPEPIKAAPANNPEQGLMYTGLQPAPKGDPCVGAYKLPDGSCTHGPDAPPPGVNFKETPAPLAAAADTPTVPATDQVAGPKDTDIAGESAADNGVSLAPASDGDQAVELVNGIACDGDGVSGKRVQVLYVRDASTPSQFAKYVETFRTWAAGVDAIYNSSAQDTGGERHVRYVTTSDCKVDVQEVAVPDGSMADFGKSADALKKLGYGRTDRTYMMFADSKVYCGIGYFAGDTRKGSVNRSNTGPWYGRSDTGCWGAHTAAHELGHNLGAVNNNSPNSSKAGHCNDEYDVMCYQENGQTIVYKCNDRNKFEQKLDCNHDDYYNTNPSAGSYLANNWNVADNEFLIKGSGSGGNPDPSPSPSTQSPSPRPPSPSPSKSPTGGPTSPTAGPSPTGGSPKPPSPTGSPSPTDGTGTLKELSATATTSTQTRLSWPAAPNRARYTLVVNGGRYNLGRQAGVVVAGLRPSTAYTFQVLLSNGTPWTKTLTVTTPAAANTPAAGQWFNLTNALNGSVATFFGGNRGDGSPLLAGRSSGVANQQWKLEKVDGTEKFRLRSKATDRCIGAYQGKPAAGTPLVQTDCAGATEFTLTSTAFGTSLTTGDGLVIGVGHGQYWQQRLLTLQKSSGARHQSWTFAKA
ncbi:hypothetical protein Val02_75280 [Virgisporangium aliadipatigenens]|uniref:Fibronectin type-III domain-containing protein n=1 Tax=Virgisporangium aliadipatigenens TaxID=741659 RepID=A0A8J3YU16_9ACTN|nr:RICIN domain-containing protein [Virgisporangium aliadipatigenens]GIJ50642.1 hypothetical protein Val02_75280 [Virgisporangium aliadipatigenens]